MSKKTKVLLTSMLLLAFAYGPSFAGYIDYDASNNTVSVNSGLYNAFIDSFVGGVVQAYNILLGFVIGVGPILIVLGVIAGIVYWVKRKFVK